MKQAAFRGYDVSAPSDIAIPVDRPQLPTRRRIDVAEFGKMSGSTYTLSVYMVTFAPEPRYAVLEPALLDMVDMETGEDFEVFLNPTPKLKAHGRVKARSRPGRTMREDWEY